LHEGECVIVKDDFISRLRGKIHHHIGALAGGQINIIRRHRRGQEPLIAADVLKQLVAGKREVVEARV